MIDTLKVVISVDNIRAALVDDTGLHHQPLLNFEIDSIEATLKMETGAESAKSYILRRLGIYEFPFMEGKFSLNVVANYYNYEAAVYEPLIETWDLKAKIRKTLPNGFDKEGIITVSK